MMCWTGVHTWFRRFLICLGRSWYCSTWDYHVFVGRDWSGNLRDELTWGVEAICVLLHRCHLEV